MPFVQLRRFPERGRDAVVRVQRPANGGHVIVIGAQLHGLSQRGRPPGSEMAAGRRRGLDQDGIALPESADVVDAQADGRRHLQAVRRGGLARQFPAVRVRDADPARVPDLGDVIRGGRMRRRRNERGQQACQHGQHGRRLSHES